MIILFLRVFEPAVLFAVGKGHVSKEEIPTVLPCFQILQTTRGGRQYSVLHLPSWL